MEKEHGGLIMPKAAIDVLCEKIHETKSGDPSPDFTFRGDLNDALGWWPEESRWLWDELGRSEEDWIAMQKSQGSDPAMSDWLRTGQVAQEIR